MQPTSARLKRGFTLIELVIVMLIVAVLLKMATPMVRQWIQNTQIRSTAEALQNALRFASAEAVRRSQNVIFVLTAAPPVYDGTPATTGTYWYLQAVPTLTSQTMDATYYIQGSPQSFGSSGLSISSNNQARICYNSLGRQITNTAGSGAWPNLPGTCTAGETIFTVSGAAGTRSYKVYAELGGKVRMCNPALTFSASNPDGC